jgi:hypothetical protein
MDELARIDTAEEMEIVSVRRDGALGGAVMLALALAVVLAPVVRRRRAGTDDAPVSRPRQTTGLALATSPHAVPPSERTSTGEV